MIRLPSFGRDGDDGGIKWRENQFACRCRADAEGPAEQKGICRVQQRGALLLSPSSRPYPASNVSSPHAGSEQTLELNIQYILHILVYSFSSGYICKLCKYFFKFPSVGGLEQTSSLSLPAAITA